MDKKVFFGMYTGAELKIYKHLKRKIMGPIRLNRRDCYILHVAIIVLASGFRLSVMLFLKIVGS